ncbi:calcium/proton exchanger [Mycena filopes]|nr:calcium/proton exchanger [Mycena filopes]
MLLYVGRPLGRWLQVKPVSELGPIPGVWASIKNIARASILVWLSPFILVALLFGWVKVTTNDVVIFIICFIAIIPLAKLLAFATDELSLRVGQSLAGFLNATLGNLVELLVAVQALGHCELGIVQSSLIGSMLSNLLLVLGMSCLVGGVKYSEQGFAAGAAQVNNSLLLVSAATVLLPAVYQAMSNKSGTVATAAATQAHILNISHAISIGMIVVYVAYVGFQLVTHKAMYRDDSPDITMSTRYKKKEMPVTSVNLTTSEVRDSRGSGSLRLRETTSTSSLQPVDLSPSRMNEPQSAEESPSAPEDEVEHVKVNGYVCFVLLGAVVACTARITNSLVGSIDGLTSSGVLSKEFVGIVLLPIAGNAAEHATAVISAGKNKLTLSMSVAVGSSIQIGFFVIPLIVVIGWGKSKPMTLLFDPYEAACLFFAVLAVNSVVQDGKSNWLERAVLTVLYVVFAILFFFYAGVSPADHFAVCS